MMPAMCPALMEAIDFTANAVTVFAERCADGIAADRARCEEMVERGLAMTTALVPIIGYDRAAKIAQKALATGKIIREVAEEVLAPQDLAGVLDPWQMIKRRYPRQDLTEILCNVRLESEGGLYAYDDHRDRCNNRPGIKLAGLRRRSRSV